jgi:hypothetical protein
MPSVIRNWNTPNIAVTLSGHHVRREEAIFLASHERAYKCLPTGMHFCFKDPAAATRRGSTIMCTCGASAGVFGHEAYKRWTSVWYGSEVIACTEFIQQGKHADGSHE